MSRRPLGTFFAAAIAVLAAAQGVQAADHPTLYVDYRDDCTFRLTNDAGATVTQVAAGTYQVAVATPEPFAANIDVANPDSLYACKGFVSFRLTGPGVNAFTTLDHGDGAFDLLAVVFQAGGTYTAQDDGNIAGTRRTISATAAAAAPIPASAASSSASSAKKQTQTHTDVDLLGSALRGKLAASVSTSGKLTLTFKGKPVSELKAGRYAVMVLDETSKSAFKLQRGTKPALTLSSKAHLGRRSVTVTLVKGQWVFYSTPAKKQFFAVIA